MLIQLKPAPPLDRLVETLWASERPGLAHERELSLPTGRANLVIPLLQTHVIRHDDEAGPAVHRVRGPVLQGACDRYLVRGGTALPSSAIGVQFKPGGAAWLTGVPMGELRNTTVALDGLMGLAADDLREQLLALPDAPSRLRRLADWLAARASTVQPDEAIQWALHRFDSQPACARIGHVQRASGLSPAHFIDRFRDVVGLTPKRYCRVRRLQTVLQRAAPMAPVAWAELALDAGFADQAHLAHEFRRIAGVSPSRYRPVSSAQPNHVALFTTAKKSTRPGEPVKASSLALPSAWSLR